MLKRIYLVLILAAVILGVAFCGPQASDTSVKIDASVKNDTRSAPEETPNSQTSNKANEDDANDLFQEVKLDFPQADPVLGMIGSREQQSLNGQWAYIVDPMGVGNPNVLSGGFFKDRKNISGMELLEYDFDAADELRVPGDWNSQSERLFFYRGQIWYRRLFSAAPKRSERYHLHFGGANFDAQVFLNSKPVGVHKGGYVPFSFDVTKALEKGQNSLVVRVDNRLDASTIPTARTDWWPYGGLTRDVALVTTPKAFIRNAKLSLSKGATDRLAIEVETEGFQSGAEVTIAIPELGISQELRTDKSGRASAVIEATPELWSPDNPKLYDVVLRAGKDDVRERIGFRSIETRGTQIVLNGKPIKFRGISTHEEPIGEAGAAYSREHVVGLLTEAKALGANFVRAAHYPYSRHLAEAADEVGLLLWEEIPVYWAIDWSNPETLSIARNMMERLIRRDWNRASVIIWSVANETPASDARMAFLKTLIADTRRLDDTRLVSAALLGGSEESFAQILTHLAVRGLKAENVSFKEKMIFRAINAKIKGKAPKVGEGYTVVIDDPLAEYVDIISYNEYFGWYYSKIFAEQTGLPEGLIRRLMLDFIPDMRIAAKLEKPIHISEFGAGAKAGNHAQNLTTNGAPEVHIWTEEYQANVYAAQIEMLRNSSQVQGMTPWILKDFRAMLRPRAGVQDFYNRKGLIDETGQKKLAYDVLMDFYTGPWDAEDSPK
ncbi:MAG: glycoside hydrolase family 2 TIM barrel-domain containing protein [Maricaulaceae bacterium]